jgi:hypothetical protein
VVRYAASEFILHSTVRVIEHDARQSSTRERSKIAEVDWSGDRESP